MDRLERIEAAEKGFDDKYGGMDDEWTETFDLACRFARRLVDCGDGGSSKLCEDVILWIEESIKIKEGDNY